MTINLADNTPRVSYALAQGATQQVFTVSFEFFDDADLNVYIDGTLKTLTNDYLTADNNDVNDRQAHTSGTTGFIHFTSVLTGATGGSTILITRSIDIERTTDFPTSGAFQIETLNTELDRTTAILADLNDKNVRSVKLADTDTTATLTIPDADTRPNKYLGFDGSGNLAALSGTGSTIGTIDTANLADALITTVKLADSSVTSAKILDGTIATADIADDAITASKLNISGNGTSGQVVKSDGDGSFSYLTLATGFVSGMLMPYAGASAPSGWLLCYGQAISRTTYADLFTALGTTYGVGDGSTTFNLPDLRGRVVAGQDDMGGSSANRLTDAVTGGLNGDTLGDTGGTESHTLTSAQSGLVGHTHGVSASLEATSGSGSGDTGVDTGDPAFQGNNAADNTSMINVSISAVASADASEAHNIVQPTIILNYIIKE